MWFGVNIESVKIQIWQKIGFFSKLLEIVLYFKKSNILNILAPNPIFVIYSVENDR